MKLKIVFNTLKQKLLKSSFYKDSAWAIVGNSIGSFLMLVAGIIIARFLGKELYGEYGMVKVTMFNIAAFSTFGLSYTSTKFVAEYLAKKIEKVPSIARDALYITLVTSSLLCVLVVVFARPIALYCNAESLTMPFRVLGFLIIFRALSQVFAGIMGGFKLYKEQGINNIVSGLVFVIICVPFTYWGNLIGALMALSIYQVLLSVLNGRTVYKSIAGLNAARDNSSTMGLLVKFSIPVAGQEFTYFLVSWLSPILITRYASLGELGIYNACAQWFAICLYIPGLLRNVSLSYLSTANGKPIDQISLVKRILGINLVSCTAVFLIVLLFSKIIASFYGETFIGMERVLNVLIMSSIFQSVIVVFSDNMLAEGRNWQMFILRSLRDLLTIGLLAFVLIRISNEHAALSYAYIQLAISVLYAVILSLMYYFQHKKFRVEDEK